MRWVSGWSEGVMWGGGEVGGPILGTEETLHLVGGRQAVVERQRRWAWAGVGVMVGLVVGLVVGFGAVGVRGERSVRVPAVVAVERAVVLDAGGVDAGAVDAAPSVPLIDPALAEAERLLASGAPAAVGAWLDQHPDAGHPDSRDRLRGLARLAAGEIEAGLALLQAVMSRRPGLAGDEATAAALLGILGHREAEDAVALLARMSRLNAGLAAALVERAGDDHYRTRKRAWLAVDAADGDVAAAGHRYYVRNLRVVDCDIRRHAVDRLRELGDPAAIGPIRQMDAREGFFGKLCMDGAIERAVGSLRRRQAVLEAGSGGGGVDGGDGG